MKDYSGQATSSRWQDATLGDHIHVKHGYAFKSEYFGADGPYALVTPGNFFEAGGFRSQKEKQKRYHGPLPEGFLLCAGDLIVAMTEQAEGLLGSSAIVPGDDAYLHNQRIGLVSSGDMDRRFLYYLFNYKPVRAQISASASGTKVRHTSPSRIGEVKFSFPPLQTQRRVASILSSYDELIEVNARRIAILEEMARRIFDKWFVKFRFPGHEAVQLLKEGREPIPPGWKASPVRDLVERRKSATIYRKADCDPFGAVIVVDQSSDALLGFHSGPPDHEASAENPLIIFGDHTCKMQLLTAPFSVGQNTIVFGATAQAPTYFLYQLIKGLTSTHEYKRHWNDLIKKTVAVAPRPLAEKYDNLVRPFFEAVARLHEINRNLRTSRDLLLPKLISGEIDLERAGRDATAQRVAAE